MGELWVRSRRYVERLDFEDGWDAKGTKNMRVTTVVLSYRRAILIAVYTHLLREYRVIVA
jgi:hypothetical protein